MTAHMSGGSGELVLHEAHVLGVARRDPDALASCYEALADPLYRYVRGLCGDPTLAEDLVEETFLELVQAAPQLTGGVGGLRAWLFRAARNNLIDAKRKITRQGNVPLDEVVIALRPDADPGPEAIAVMREREAVLQDAMAELSDDQREVLLLRFAVGMSGPEIAAATNRTVGAVKSLQHRGLAAMARILGTDPSLEAALRDDP